MPPFRYETSVKLHQTDAAGIMFFGQMFFVAHDAYSVCGQPIVTILEVPFGE